MSLVTEFVARYSDARVRALTLADNQTGSAYDSTKLAQAATDAAEEFEDICGVELVDTNTKHITVGVLLMEALLLEWGTGQSAEAKAVREKAQKRAEQVAKVTGRNRVLPDTDSALEPSTPLSERPAFDRRHTDAFRLRPPLGQSTSEDEYASA